MKKLALVLTISLQFFASFAQDKTEEVKPWAYKGVTGINFSQTALSNWAAGGENSVAGNAYFNGSLIHKSGNWLWENNLVLEYGLTNTKSLGTRKSSDKIDFASKLGYSTNNKWYYTGLVDFKSQFNKGYNYSDDNDDYISKFMAPGYSNISLGIEYRPNDNFSAYFSPIAGKLTFVLDDRLSDMGAFGVDKGDKFRAEIGAYLKLKAQRDLMENVKLITKADFFTAYNSSFGNIDVDWDVLVNFKINKYLSANINTTLKYDDDVKSIKSDGTQGGPRIQFKEVIGVGIAYNF